MNNKTFQTAVDLCKAEQSRIDELWRDDPAYYNYKLEVEVMDVVIHIFPAKDDCLHCASKFFQIANLLDAAIYIDTFHRNDGTIVPSIRIF